MNIEPLPREFLTVPEIARLLRCRESKVSGWIKAGSLLAINVSEGRRPRYRIARQDLDAFLQRRSVTPAESRPARRTRREASVPRYV